MARVHFKRYVHNSLSASTQAAYAGDLKAFIKWGGKIPATPQMLARYLASKAELLKISTLRRHLASIARAHVVKGLEPPTTSPLVKATLRGIMRVHGAKLKQATPLTPAIMRKIGGRLASLSKLRDARDRALLLVGYAGGFRQSEITNLTPADLKFTKKGVVIRLRTSKTDPYQLGRDVALMATGNSLCAVAALKRWLQLYDPAADAPLFTAIDRYDHVRSTRLSSIAVGWILRERMRAFSLDPAGFSAHSLRSGFVSTAAKLGVPLWSIQRQTGHKSANTVHRYIRGLDIFEQNASGRLLS